MKTGGARQVIDVGAMLGADNARAALSTFLGREIPSGETTVELKSIMEMPELLGGMETEVATVLMEIEGDMPGNILLILYFESAGALVRQTTKDLEHGGGNDEMAVSALKEIGNILLSSFVNSFIDVSGLSMELSPPCFSRGPCGAVLDCLMSAYEQMGGRCLFIQTGFHDLESFIKAHILFLPYPSAMERFEASFENGMRA